MKKKRLQIGDVPVSKLKKNSERKTASGVYIVVIAVLLVNFILWIVIVS